MWPELHVAELMRRGRRQTVGSHESPALIGRPRGRAISRATKATRPRADDHRSVGRGGCPGRGRVEACVLAARRGPLGDEVHADPATGVRGEVGDHLRVELRDDRAHTRTEIAGPDIDSIRAQAVGTQQIEEGHEAEGIRRLGGVIAESRLVGKDDVVVAMNDRRAIVCSRRDGLTDQEQERKGGRAQ